MNDFDYNSPNTRQRIAARRRALAERDGSAVVPGPRRVLGTWLTTGWIVSAALLIGALTVLAYVATSPRFSVRDVQVEGAGVMKAEDVAALAGAQGESIWFVDAARIVERLQTSPYVEAATVDVLLPDRLEIAISERRPEIRWQTGGQRFLVDATGLVLGVDTTGALTNTLVIEDRGGGPVKPNDRLDTGTLELARALALRLPRELGIAPAAIGWEVGAGISITTPDRRTIVFGSDENLEEKLAILQLLLKDQTAFTYLDLRPSTPYYRNEGGAPPQPETPSEP
jgi:cell division protein FtsQ